MLYTVLIVAIVWIFVPAGIVSLLSIRPDVRILFCMAIVYFWIVGSAVYISVFYIC